MPKTKAQSSFAVATWIIQFLLYLYPKFQECSFLLRMYRPLCVRPVGNPEDLVSGITAHIVLYIFSSPEPSGSQGELIVYPCSVVRPSVRRPSFSKIFSSETAWPIKAKFYMKHLWEGGTNVYINNPGHMTKMAAMPIYDKNPSKIFSETTGPISTKLGMKH